jgi:hypothetical protein
MNRGDEGGAKSDDSQKGVVFSLLFLFYCSDHRVGRVLRFFSSRRNWNSPTPLAAGECAPPPFGPGGREHSLAGEGLGEPQFRRGDIHCGALYL